MGSETELKFRVFEKDPGEIIDAILKDSEIISKETHKLTNEYYDTEDLQLMRSRSGFRVRSTDGVYEETVKTSARSGGGLATRKEFNIPLKDPRPDLSLFPPEAFPFETENLEEVSKGLKKLFSSDVERTSWLVKSASGTSEISLDLGAVKSGSLTDEIREVEIELKDGAEKAIFETAEKIISSGKITLRAESRSPPSCILKSCGCQVRRQALHRYRTPLCQDPASRRIHPHPQVRIPSQRCCSHGLCPFQRHC